MELEKLSLSEWHELCTIINLLSMAFSNTKLKPYETKIWAKRRRQLCKRRLVRVEQPYGIFFIYTYWIYTNHLPKQHHNSYILILFAFVLFLFICILVFYLLFRERYGNKLRECLHSGNQHRNESHRIFSAPFVVTADTAAAAAAANQTNEMAELLQKP